MMEMPVTCIIIGIALHIAELAGIITLFILKVCNNDD